MLNHLDEWYEEDKKVTHMTEEERKSYEIMKQTINQPVVVQQFEEDVVEDREAYNLAETIMQNAKRFRHIPQRIFEEEVMKNLKVRK